MESARYLSPDKKHWQGRPNTPDAACFFQTTRMIDLLKETPTQSDMLSFGFLGFCCDEGIRRNQDEQVLQRVRAIRQALAKLPMQKQNFHLFDAGNIVCIDGDLEASQQALAEAVHKLLAKKITPIIIRRRS